PLSTVVSIETGTDPNALTHYNQLNSATFQAVPMPGVTVGQAVDFLEGEAKKMPAGFSHDYLADSRQYVQEGNQLAITFGFALIIIFLVLAAQVRLRPILMTTAAMVTGLLPLLTATGAGAASRFSIGLVVVAGMSIGTLFTLFVLPAVYVAIATDHRAKAGSERAREIADFDDLGRALKPT